VVYQSEMSTTVKLTRETKRKLDGLKQYPRETYDDVVRRLIDEVRKPSTSHVLGEAVSYLRKRGVSDIAVFGSRARGENRPESDLDLLVSLPRGTSLLDHVGMEMELSKLLNVKVDLVSREALSPHMRESIEREAVNIE